MAIVVRCKCGKQLQAKEEQAGKKGRCPGCGRVYVIPEAAPGAAAEPGLPAAAALYKCADCGGLFAAAAVVSRHDQILCRRCAQEAPEAGVGTRRAWKIRILAGAGCAVVVALVLILHFVWNLKAPPSAGSSVVSRPVTTQEAVVTVDGAPSPESMPAAEDPRAVNLGEREREAPVADKGETPAAAATQDSAEEPSPASDPTEPSEAEAPAAEEEAMEELPIAASVREHSPGASGMMIPEIETEAGGEAADSSESAGEEKEMGTEADVAESGRPSSAPAEAEETTDSADSPQTPGTREEVAPGAWMTFPLAYRQISDFDDPIVSLTGRWVQRQQQQPPQIKRLPRQLDRASFYAAELGQQRLFLILESSSRPKLYADTDFDGDLAEERFQAVATNQDGSRRYRYHSGVIGLVLPGSPKKTPIDTVVQWHDENNLMLFAAGCHTGKVRLGGMSQQVALVDSNLDGRKDGVLSISDSSFGVWTRKCDGLGIDRNNNGRFDQRIFENMEMQPLTAMLEMKGAYYIVEAAPDGSRIRLAPVKPPLGILDLRGQDLELVLLSDAGLQQVRGSQGKRELPAGPYTTAYFRLSRTADNGSKWTLAGAGPSGKLARFEIRPGSATTLEAGGPLSIRTQARKYRDYISIELSLVGRAEEAYTVGVEENGRRLSPPQLRIVDTQGRILANGTFGYGSGSSYRYLWRGPTDFRGRVEVQVDLNMGPFTVARTPQWHTIN